MNQPSPVHGLETELISQMPVTLVLSLHEVVTTYKRGAYYVEGKDENNNIVREKEKTVCPAVLEPNRSAARLDYLIPTNHKRTRQNGTLTTFVGTALALVVTSNSSCTARASFNRDIYAPPSTAEE